MVEFSSVSHKTRHFYLDRFNLEVTKLSLRNVLDLVPTVVFSTNKAIVRVVWALDLKFLSERTKIDTHFTSEV